MAVLEPGLHVMGHQFWPSRVRSQINVVDPVSDPIFVVFARDLLLLLGREYAISGILCTLYFHVILFTKSDTFRLSIIQSLLVNVTYSVALFIPVTSRRHVYEFKKHRHSVTRSVHWLKSIRVGSGRVTGNRFRPGSISSP